MLSKHDMETVGEILASVYGKPQIETVDIPPPEPYEVELEEDVLKAGAGKHEKAASPQKRKIKVRVSTEDYPLKTVEIRKAQKTTRTVTEDVDVGPSDDYLITSIAIWILSAFFAFLAYANGSPILLVLGLVGIAIGGWLFRRLKRTHRIMVPEERLEVSWRLVSEKVTIDVDPKYAPRTKERVIPNEEEVVAIGRIPIAFEAIPMGDGTVLANSFETSSRPSLAIPVLERASELCEKLEELDVIAHQLPVILGGRREDVPLALQSTFRDGVALRGEELSILELFRDLTNIYRGIHTAQFQPNIVHPSSALTDLLEPVSVADDVATLATPDLSNLVSSYETNITQHPELQARNMVETWRENKLVLSALRYESLNHQVARVIPESGWVSHYAAFHFYCLDCIRETADGMMTRDYSISSTSETPPVYFSSNSRCTYDPESKSWRCRTCDSLHPNDRVIPMHKILDEVLYPTYDRLMEEHRNIRFEMDNKTRDEEMSYKNKMDQELSLLTQGHEGATAETRNRMELLRAEITGDNRAVDEIKSIMELYEMGQSKAVETITEKTRSIQSAVAESTRKILQETQRSFDARLDAYEREMTDLSVAKRKEDEVRDQIQLEILENATDIAQNTGRIAVHTERIADNTDEMKDSLERIDSSTAVTAENTARTAENTGRTAESTERLEATTTDMARSLHRNNALTAAVAVRQGVSAKYVKKVMKK